MLKENIEKIRSELKKNEDVCLLAVSKTKSINLIKEAYDYGVRDFGENKVQEFLSKYENLPKDIRWHFIGHLQTNKIKKIIDKVELIHSLDSLTLADALEKEASKKSLEVKALIELNIANEDTKFGFTEKEFYENLERFSKYRHLKILGLMTVAPFVSDSEENREIFARMKKIFVDIRTKRIDNIIMKFLSMGMSNDYQIAIEEGANIIRLGTSLFGER